MYQIMQGDSHIHSTHSDGLMSPKDIISTAESRALDFIGIADHDTLSGSHEMIRQLADNNARLIGISSQEISLGHHLHLLILGSKKTV